MSSANPDPIDYELRASLASKHGFRSIGQSHHPSLANAGIPSDAIHFHKVIASIGDICLPDEQEHGAPSHG